MSMDNTEAAEIVEELGLDLYRVTDNVDALDDALDVAAYLREGADGSQEPEIPYDEGDTVIDEKSPHWADSSDVEVVEITDTPSNEFRVGFGQSVADENTDYPDDDPVVRASPVDSDKTYAYPASRLKSQE